MTRQRPKSKRENITARRRVARKKGKPSSWDGFFASDAAPSKDFMAE